MLIIYNIIIIIITSFYGSSSSIIVIFLSIFCDFTGLYLALGPLIPAIPPLAGVIFLFGFCGDFGPGPVFAITC